MNKHQIVDLHRIHKLQRLQSLKVAEAEVDYRQAQAKLENASTEKERAQKAVRQAAKLLEAFSVHGAKVSVGALTLASDIWDGQLTAYEVSKMRYDEAAAVADDASSRLHAQKKKDRVLEGIESRRSVAYRHEVLSQAEREVADLWMMRVSGNANRNIT